jgi:hypothetical protein
VAHDSGSAYLAMGNLLLDKAEKARYTKVSVIYTLSQRLKAKPLDKA